MTEVSADDALRYVSLVKAHFGVNSSEYNQFLGVLKTFKTLEIDTNEVIERITTLFRGHTQLLLGFNLFLPDDCKLEFPRENISNAASGAAVDTVAAAKTAGTGSPQMTKAPKASTNDDTSKKQPRDKNTQKQKDAELTESKADVKGKDGAPPIKRRLRGRISISSSSSPPNKNATDSSTPNTDPYPMKDPMKSKEVDNATHALQPKQKEKSKKPDIILTPLPSTNATSKFQTPSLLYQPDPLSEKGIAAITADCVACKICKGRRNSTATNENEPILLCDQKGCNAEYHLGCLPPSLFQTKKKNTGSDDDDDDDDDSNDRSFATSASSTATNTASQPDSTVGDATTIKSIPEGDIFCKECATDGATSVLRKYFDRCDYVRSHYSCSRAHVLGLLEKHMRENPDGNVAPSNGGENGDISSMSHGEVPLRPPPRSELWYVDELNRLALMDPSSSGIDNSLAVEGRKDEMSNDNDNKQLETVEYSAEFLIGKPLRLYCPLDNNYHIGRIVDFRACSVYPSLDKRCYNPLDLQINSVHINDLEYYGMGSISESEFLVRFPSGVEGRKKELLQWIILEEHSLAVGISLIRGQAAKLKGRINGWKPAMILARSALELVPVRQFLYENERGELFGEMKSNMASKSMVTASANINAGADRWALASFFGEEAHGLLHLRDEAKDLFFKESINRSLITNGSSSAIAGLEHPPRSPIPPSATEEEHQQQQQTQQHSSITLDVPLGLALVEQNEQERCREWFKLILQNPLHRLALTSCDEYSVPLYLEKDGTNDDGERKGESRTRSSSKKKPLVDRGIDRLWLAQLAAMASTPLERSRDTIMSFNCEKVTSVASAMSTLQQQ